MKFKLLFFLLIFVYSFIQTNAQTDTTSVAIASDTLIVTQEIMTKKEHKPSRAILLSAVLPGAGQAYNKQYWKIPLFYSALGTTAFTFNIYNKQYKKYVDALKQIKIKETDTAFIRTIYPNEEESTLSQYKDKKRRTRDLSVLLFGAIYALNIIDATVYAHLANFDVSDDLSLTIKPQVFPLYTIKSQNTIGLSISLKF